MLYTEVVCNSSRSLARLCSFAFTWKTFHGP